MTSVNSLISMYENDVVYPNKKVINSIDVLKQMLVMIL